LRKIRGSGGLDKIFGGWAPRTSAEGEGWDTGLSGGAREILRGLRPLRMTSEEPRTPNDDGVTEEAA
jgi:hypothetical protein